MPLVTAARFPGLFAQPSNRGLTEGINSAFGNVSNAMIQNKIMEKRQNDLTLQSRAEQFEWLRSIENPDKQRMEFLKLASDAHDKNEPNMDEDFFNAMNITNPDELNLHFAKVATRGNANRDIRQGKQVPLHFSGMETLKDSKGNIFYGQAIGDRTTAGVSSSLIAADGTDRKPEGELSLVNRGGETPKEKVENRVETAQQVEEIKTEEALKRTEGGKKVELDYAGRIAEAKELAREKAKDEGEAFNDLEQMEASLPVLRESIAELSELAEIATYTTGGKVFDLAVKEFGFGATEGATARAKFIAIVNNQVLPLLRPTFGAAFTVPEGDSLRATMGDPDATPEEKQAQLEVFIDQKERDIRAKQQRLSPTDTNQGSGQVLRFDAQGNQL